MARPIMVKLRDAVGYAIVVPFVLCCAVAIGCAMMICGVGIRTRGTGRMREARRKAHRKTMEDGREMNLWHYLLIAKIYRLVPW